MTTAEPCPRTEALSALVDGALAPRERAETEAHAAGCPLCAPMLARMRELHADFASLPQPSRAFDLASEVDRRIGALAPPSGRAPARAARGRWRSAAWLAPGGAVAVGVGLWLGASLVPASVAMPSAQMAAFSAMPAGALCPAPGACARPVR